MRNTLFGTSMLLLVSLTWTGRAMGEPADASPPEAASSALVQRFADCFAAQVGAAPSAEDLELLTAAAGDLVALLFGDRCSGGECGAELRDLSCESLAGLMDSALVVTPPDWAIALAGALISRSTTCFESEMGRPPTEEEADWLRQYRELMERQYVDVISLLGCEVDTARVGGCVADLRAMPCGDANPQNLLEGLARTFGGACGEMFTCSAGAGSDSPGADGGRIDEILASEDK